MTTKLCDQDPSGVETAKVAVYTKNGELMLCQHHFNENHVLFAALQYDFRPLEGPLSKRRFQSPMGQFGGQWR
jgi:hypothetical protein